MNPVPKFLLTWLPNRTQVLALVSLNHAPVFRSYWPCSVTQIVGGKHWSLSVVHLAKHPEVTNAKRVIPKKDSDVPGSQTWTFYAEPEIDMDDYVEVSRPEAPKRAVYPKDFVDENGRSPVKPKTFEPPA